VFPSCLSFVISLGRLLSSWDRPGGMAKESLQRAAIARTAAGKRSKNVRRHSLDRLHASMIKQKKKLPSVPVCTCLDGVEVSFAGYFE